MSCRVVSVNVMSCPVAGRRVVSRRGRSCLLFSSYEVPFIRLPANRYQPNLTPPTPTLSQRYTAHIPYQSTHAVMRSSSVFPPVTSSLLFVLHPAAFERSSGRQGKQQIEIHGRQMPCKAMKGNFLPCLTVLGAYLAGCGDRLFRLDRMRFMSGPFPQQREWASCMAPAKMLRATVTCTAGKIRNSKTRRISHPKTASNSGPGMPPWLVDRMTCGDQRVAKLVYTSHG